MPGVRLFLSLRKLVEQASISIVNSTPKNEIPKRRWRIAWLLGLGVLVNYFDRVNLSVSHAALYTTFGISTVTFGYLSEHFMTFYGGNRADVEASLARVDGPYAPIYWTMLFCNCVVTQLLWSKKIRENLIIQTETTKTLSLGPCGEFIGNLGGQWQCRRLLS